MRKRAIAYIGADELAALLKLPPGLSVVAVTPEFVRNGICVAIEGDSLAPVQDGAIPPDFTNPDGSRFTPAFNDWSDGYRTGYLAGSGIAPTVVPPKP